LSEFDCVYSPAKRRGPVPGKAGQARKASEISVGDAGRGGGGSNYGGGGDFHAGNMMGGANALWNQGGVGGGAAAALLAGQQVGGGAGVGGGGGAESVAAALHQQLGLLRQLQAQQQLSQQQPQQIPMDTDESMTSETEEPSARRARREAGQNQQPSSVPRTITNHTHLLERNDAEGTRLYAYYRLSIDEMFKLPPTPTDEEYCARAIAARRDDGDDDSPITPDKIPGPHLAALSAARFAEIALGALVHNEVSTAMELCNAVVHCLREAVSAMYGTSDGDDQTTSGEMQLVLREIAKAYFLLGVFRAFRGDMPRYFKYRRICLSNLAKLEASPVGIFLFFVLFNLICRARGFESVRSRLSITTHVLTLVYAVDRSYFIKPHLAF